MVIVNLTVMPPEFKSSPRRSSRPALLLPLAMGTAVLVPFFAIRAQTLTERPMGGQSQALRSADTTAILAPSARVADTARESRFFAQAIEALEQIPADKYDYQKACALLGLMQVAFGQSEQALDWISQRLHAQDWPTWRVIEAVALRHYAHGDFAAAWKLIDEHAPQDSNVHSFVRSDAIRAYRNLALAAIQVGDSATAGLAMYQAQEQCAGLSTSEKADELLWLGRDQFRIGMDKEAKINLLAGLICAAYFAPHVINLNFELDLGSGSVGLGISPDTSAYIEGKVMEAMDIFMEAGHIGLASRFLSQVQNQKRRGDIAIRLAEHWALGGQVDSALALLSDLRPDTSRFPDQFSSAANNCIDSLVEMGRVEQARWLASRVPPYMAAESRQALVLALVGINQVSEALALFELPNYYRRNRYRDKSFEARMRDYDRSELIDSLAAQGYMAEAQAQWRKMHDKSDWSLPAASLALGWTKEGQFDKAHRMLPFIHLPWKKGDVLLELAQAHLGRGQSADAAAALRAAEASLNQDLSVSVVWSRWRTALLWSHLGNEAEAFRSRDLAAHLADLQQSKYVDFAGRDLAHLVSSALEAGWPEWAERTTARIQDPYWRCVAYAVLQMDAAARGPQDNRIGYLLNLVEPHEEGR